VRQATIIDGAASEARGADYHDATCAKMARRAQDVMSVMKTMMMRGRARYGASVRAICCAMRYSVVV